MDGRNLADLTQLNEEEVIFKNQLLDLIKTREEFDLSVFIEMGEEALFAYAESDPLINHFFETNPILNQEWKLRLKDLNYPDFPLRSADGTQSISLFSQLKGAYLLDDEERRKIPGVLDKACEIGMYDALVKRLKLNCANFQAMNDVALRKIFHDVDMLQNFYGSSGCFAAGIQLYELSNKLYDVRGIQQINQNFFRHGAKDFSWSILDNARQDQIPLFVTVIQAAAELLFLSKYLSERDEYKALDEALDPSRNILAAAPQFKNWHEIQQAVFRKLEAFHIPQRETLLQRADTSAQEKLAARIQRLHKAI